MTENFYSLAAALRREELEECAAYLLRELDGGDAAHRTAEAADTPGVAVSALSAAMEKLSARLEQAAGQAAGAKNSSGKADTAPYMTLRREPEGYEARQSADNETETRIYSPRRPTGDALPGDGGGPAASYRSPGSGAGSGVDPNRLSEYFARDSRRMDAGYERY